MTYNFIIRTTCTVHIFASNVFQMSEHTCMSKSVLNKYVKYLSFNDIQMKVDIRKVERVAVGVHLSLYENRYQNK